MASLIETHIQLFTAVVAMHEEVNSIANVDNDKIEIAVKEITAVAGEGVIEKVKTTIDALDYFSMPIPQILTGHLLISICADQEEVIKNSIFQKLKPGFRGVVTETFTKSINAFLIRNFDWDSLGSYCAWFHLDYKKRFKESVSEENRRAYQDLRSNRNNFAHRVQNNFQLNCTFQEVVEFYRKSKTVVTSFCNTLKG